MSVLSVYRRRPDARSVPGRSARVFTRQKITGVMLTAIPIVIAIPAAIVVASPVGPVATAMPAVAVASPRVSRPSDHSEGR